MSEKSNAAAEEKDIVLYETHENVAIITMNRPQYNNAQNGRMTYELDDAFKRAVDDDNVKVIILKGAGKHFSAGHDIGTPGRDINDSQDRKTLWYDHANKTGGEFLYVREAEAYLGMCRRWRDAPKPTIAMVQGACIAGGLMLAWVCDLIVASDDAFFSDPVVRMGIPGVEYFAHPYELNPRIAKEFLFTGDRMSAERAYQMGMVNRVVSRDSLDEETLKLATKVAEMPRLGLTLTKQAINHIEDLQGKRTGMDAAFAWHHFAHTHNELETGHKLAGQDAKSMAAKNKAES
ncbi:enoyl-CoA hydratase [Aestuariicella hydrocarbonica]|uniref:Enoyl-CoA hydratase n=1 Tax=Pseudomaricurvus hydrocarbonicus TaxID=1470433 RepID=A0A9E5JVM9_9GAMM|nr:enoyl-CoA hydratase [Aestuariicella hydrocarbonica]NHO66079.1 enoyl-CoA hydratase [Aestuariicella hydrocarbonica]